MQYKFKNDQNLTEVQFRLKYPNYKKAKDKYFYEYYFKDIAEQEGISIENFFHFRTGAYRYTREIPNSVTKKSVNLWKMNPLFIQEIVSYINTSLISNFKSFNTKKIQIMISNWSNTLRALGPTKGQNTILKILNSRGCKLPWTINEVNQAVKTTLIFLN